jgi:hypothetical protein
MIYELRIYECTPGKRPDLIRRFNDHTLALFDKHGFRHDGFMTSTTDPDQLIYFLIWDDMAERDAKFPRFLEDPVWIKVRDDSVRNGPITTKITSQFYESLTFPSAT